MDGKSRIARTLCVVAFVAAVSGATAATSAADGPYPFKATVRLHNAIEFDPGVLIDASPCFVTTADVTEVFNVEANVRAAGMDGDNFVPPVHVEQTREESLRIVPTDPTLPIYTGHSTAHFTNFEDSPNTVTTNTINLHGTDGSHLLSHENIHILLKPSGIDLLVDNAHMHVQCG